MENSLEQKPWYRFLKVLYIALFAISVGVTLLAVYGTKPYKSYYNPEPDYGVWFILSLLALFIIWVLLKLLRIGTLYVVSGNRPLWERELKKFY